MIRAIALSICLSMACGGGSSNKPAATAPETEPLATTAKPDPAPPRSLFDRLGGLPAITAVVAEFVGRTTSDPRIKERFFNADADNLKRLLVEFVCQATGGPCKYVGRDMKTTHARLNIREREWDAMVADFRKTLDKFKVPAAEQSELITIVGSTKPDIVVSGK